MQTISLRSALSVAAVGLMFIAPTFAETRHEWNAKHAPEVSLALKDLQNAKAKLLKAGPDLDGNGSRRQAIQHINQAIELVRSDMTYKNGKLINSNKKTN